MKRKGGCGRLILVIIGFAVFVFALDFAGDKLDRRRFPWGYVTPGVSTLAGTWVGPVATKSGEPLAMLIDMKLAPLDYHRRRGQMFRTRRSTWLIGRVLTCKGPGRPAEFVLDGDPEDQREASRFRLSMHPADSISPDGLAPSHMKGQWGGKDSITLDVSLYMRRGKSAISGPDYPDTGRDTRVTLTRGTEAEFTALCGKL